jgi:catechol 2,3-dioxygenase-like lactoylglutathione lyase family enzyme
MSSIPVPDEQTHYSSRRQDDVDALDWPVFSQRVLDLLRSAGEVLHPEPGSPTAPANELGLRNVAFEVHDLQAAVDRAATDGYPLVGGIGEYEGSWRIAYVRGPEGIIVSLAERIG